ncbi:hypothetical protein AOCH_003834 [Aspergillus ochraceoroseus]|uniref:Uncharacterized protein n=1 Tax=Aspergillus ochraceoroseus TaxID=138278 RepID=A0A0F8UTD0_9EURO|nr:hypothetical protein AOCH_003834 [Aspergillus ochraceoroseus]
MNPALHTIYSLPHVIGIRVSRALTLSRLFACGLSSVTFPLIPYTCEKYSGIPLNLENRRVDPVHFLLPRGRSADEQARQVQRTQRPRPGAEQKRFELISSIAPQLANMPALDLRALEARNQVIERRNWASENPGPILVFCIVFVVGMGVILLFAYRRWMARKAAQQQYQ